VRVGRRAWSDLGQTNARLILRELLLHRQSSYARPVKISSAASITSYHSQDTLNLHLDTTELIEFTDKELTFLFFLAPEPRLWQFLDLPASFNHSEYNHHSAGSFAKTRHIGWLVVLSAS
jgi:hypothetical protein